MNGYEHFEIAEDLALTQSEPYGPTPESAADRTQRRVLKQDADSDAIQLALVHAVLALASFMLIEPIQVFRQQ
jgi:hypothetical protein